MRLRSALLWPRVIVRSPRAFMTHLRHSFDQTKGLYSMFWWEKYAASTAETGANVGSEWNAPDGFLAFIH